MKHKGETCWMTEERDHNVRQAYKRILAETGFAVPRMEIYRRVAQSRARRFWVVPSSAKRTLYRMMYGKPISNQNPERRRMYHEIIARVREYMHNNTRASLSQAVKWVVSQPAPEFYLSINTVKHIILASSRDDIKD